MRDVCGLLRWNSGILHRRLREEWCEGFGFKDMYSHCQANRDVRSRAIQVAAKQDGAYSALGSRGSLHLKVGNLNSSDFCGEGL